MKNHPEARINKIVSLYLESQGTIRPHFILTGPTGAGKTHTIIKIADEHGIDVVSVNCANSLNTLVNSHP